MKVALVIHLLCLFDSLSNENECKMIHYLITFGKKLIINKLVKLRGSEKSIYNSLSHLGNVDIALRF